MKKEDIPTYEDMVRSISVDIAKDRPDTKEFRAWIAEVDRIIKEHLLTPESKERFEREFREGMLNLIAQKNPFQ